METNKIINKASELAEAITNSELFLEYKRCENDLMQDDDFNQLLKEFLKVKEQYEEVSKYGKYHPDLATVQKSYQEIKIKLMSHRLFKRYKRIEKELDMIIFNIEKELREVLGVKDKHNKSKLKFLY